MAVMMVWEPNPVAGFPLILSRALGNLEIRNPKKPVLTGKP